MPSDSREGSDNPAAGGYTDYWYNSNLSSTSDTAASPYFNNVSVNIAALLNSTLTIMAGDGEAQNGTAAYRCNGNASVNSGNYNSITAPGPSPGGTLVTTSAVVNRHLDGIVLLFADGHVKWAKTNASNPRGVIYKANVPFTTSQQVPTFRARE